MFSSALRMLVTVLLAAVIATPVALMSSTPQVAHAAITAAELGLPESSVPPTHMGATDFEVYVPESGHTLTGYMLDYWRANGAESVYGNPISQPFVGTNGLYSQAFERGIFQYSETWLYGDEAVIRTQPVMNDTYAHDRSERRSDGRRNGADRRTAHFPAATNDVRAGQIYNEGGRISAWSGYGISGTFGAWYESHEGWFYMGSPISEPMMIRGIEGQVFENGILLNQDGVVRPAPIPNEHPDVYGIDTTPIEQGNLPIYSEGLFYTSYNPYGVDPTTLTGAKRIEVDIDSQMMRAYQGNTLVLEAYVSTGLDPNHTEVGAFHIRIKYESQTMEGFTDSSGEVIGLGSEGDGEQYSVDDVPYVMYINYEAEALHGAYWHNNFGQRMSHGCINQPLDVAEFMFQFSPLGTPVTVTGPDYSQEN